MCNDPQVKAFINGKREPSPPPEPRPRKAVTQQTPLAKVIVIGAGPAGLAAAALLQVRCPSPS